MLLRPGLLEPSDGRGREPAGVLAEQCDQRLLEVTGGDTLEVEDRDQHLEAFRPAGGGGQNRRRKEGAAPAFAKTIGLRPAAGRPPAGAGPDLTVGQKTGAQQPLAGVRGLAVRA